MNSGRLTVNEPILLLDSKMGLNRIDPKGKTAVTEFERESYNGRTSVVRCWPKTGRTHQIRIHLQHLGMHLFFLTLEVSRGETSHMGSATQDIRL